MRKKWGNLKRRAHLIDCLINSDRQESSLNAGCEPLSADQTTQVADLIEGLMGSPPEMKSFQWLMEYLMLLHPSAQTYAANACTNYHFMLSSRENAFQPRSWKLPQGFHLVAPQVSAAGLVSSKMLDSALCDVKMLWSDDQRGTTTTDHAPAVSRGRPGAGKVARSSDHLVQSPTIIKDEPEGDEWQVRYFFFIFLSVRFLADFFGRPRTLSGRVQNSKARNMVKYCEFRESKVNMSD